MSIIKDILLAPFNSSPMHVGRGYLSTDYMMMPPNTNISFGVHLWKSASMLQQGQNFNTQAQTVAAVSQAAAAGVIPHTSYGLGLQSFYYQMSSIPIRISSVIMILIALGAALLGLFDPVTIAFLGALGVFVLSCGLVNMYVTHTMTWTPFFVSLLIGAIAGIGLGLLSYSRINNLGGMNINVPGG